LDIASREFSRTRALREDPRDGDSKDRFDEFKASFKPGDKVHEFTGEPADDRQPCYPSRGFVVVRKGRIIQGVVTESKLNDAYASAEAESLPEWGSPSAKQLEDLAQELAKHARAERIPDYWGRPI
jgi:hypothetical protein